MTSAGHTCAAVSGCPSRVARGAHARPWPCPRAQPAPELAVSSFTANCTFTSEKGDSDKLLSTLNSHDTLSTRFQSGIAFKDIVLPSFSSL